MKTLILFIALPMAAWSQTQPQTTQQYCDNQQQLVLAMKPMIDQIALNITPPAGKTTADVSNFIQMAAGLGFGERCSWMRVGDRLTMLEARMQALEAKVAALPAGGDTSALANQLNFLQNTINTMQGDILSASTKIKTAGTELAK
jgi:hypothetical protein